MVRLMGFWELGGCGTHGLLGFHGLCQLLIWLVSLGCSQTIPNVAWQWGTCLLLLPSPRRSCRARGHNSDWWDTWGAERSGEMWGSGFARVCLICTLKRICTSGPNPNRGPGQRAILSSLPRAKQGEKGRPASRVMLRGPHCCNLHPTLLPHPTSCFHPSCRCACFDPNSVQGWAEGGQQSEPGPASPSSPAACTPCFSALWHAAFIAQSPDSPPPPPTLLSPRAAQEETGGAI